MNPILAPSNVVQIKDFLPPPQRSLYELYPLPFFNRDKLSTWDVTPTGDYAADCETGRRYAVELLKTYDGSIGWSSLLGQIVADMIRAGPAGTFANGEPKAGGIVIGFMSIIGRALIPANEWMILLR
jgi:hypothetical protein